MEQTAQTDEKIPIQTEVSPLLADRARERAKAEDRSVASLLRLALIQYLDGEGP